MAHHLLAHGLWWTSGSETAERRPVRRWASVASALTLSLLCWASVPGEALAGSSAQLRVTARVVNQCTVQLPDRAPDHVLDRLEELGRGLEHRCAAPVPVHVGAQSGRFRTGSDRFEPIRIGRGRPRPDVVMVTITY